MSSVNPFCEHCTQGYELSGDPKGTIQPNGAYFHPAPQVATDANSAGTKRAVVILTDVFGLKLKNPKILADRISESLGCDVWVPDMFDGTEPFDLEAMKPLLPDQPGQMKWTVRFTFKYLVGTFKMLPKIIRIREGALDGRIHPFLKKRREEHKYAKIGAVGYCLGGAAVARAAGQKGLIDSAVVCHPGPVSTAQIKTIKVPTSWVMAEEDFTFGPKVQKEAESIFETRKGTPEAVDYEFRQWKGVTHGFACRPALFIPQVKESFEGAFAQTVEWFRKTL